MVQFALRLGSLLHRLQILLMHRGQLLRELSLLGHLTLIVVFLLLQLRCNQLVTLHLLNLLLLLFLILLVHVSIHLSRFLLHALEQLFVLQVSLVFVHLRHQFLHFLILLVFLLFLQAFFLYIDFYLLIEVGLLHIDFTLSFRSLIQLDLDIQ